MEPANGSDCLCIASGAERRLLPPPQGSGVQHYFQCVIQIEEKKEREIKGKSAYCVKVPSLPSVTVPQGQSHITQGET